MQLKLVVCMGNGAAGRVVDAVKQMFRQRNIVKAYNEFDSAFPSCIPNPLLPEKRDDTAVPVRAYGAGMGIALDGYFDRCLLFDENGELIKGYCIVGLLAEAFLKKISAKKSFMIPCLVWKKGKLCSAAGVPKMCKTEYAFIK